MRTGLRLGGTGIGSGSVVSYAGPESNSKLRSIHSSRVHTDGFRPPLRSVPGHARSKTPGQRTELLAHPAENAAVVRSAPATAVPTVATHQRGWRKEIWRSAT